MTYQDETTREDPRSNGQGWDPPGDDKEFEEEVAYGWIQKRARHEADRRFAEEMNPPVALPPVRSLTELLAEPDAEIAYRIESVATTDARTLLVSQYKAGKTTLLGNLTRSLADGALFLGRFRVNTPAERIVLIDDEMSTDMVRSWLRARASGRRLPSPTWSPCAAMSARSTSSMTRCAGSGHDGCATSAATT